MIYPIPRISTRGYYDLTSGKTLKKNRYYLYPCKYFKRLVNSQEMTIMIHGLRNNSRGAASKVVTARNKLRHLGYSHPVVGFSYDSNTTGAHTIMHARRALAVGQKIAKKNGRNLAMFIQDFKKTSPCTKIRLMGHSLGSQVILSAIEHLFKDGSRTVESVHFFGASISCDAISLHHEKLDYVIRKQITNYFSPTDNILSMACSDRYIKSPLGLVGAIKVTLPKYRQRMVTPKSHRFASYARVLNSFP